jgi:hypothetical protein
VHRKFQCYPDRQFYTIQELETHLQFKYLPLIAFEAPSQEQEIRIRGLEKWRANEIALESQELGKQFIQHIESEYIPDVSIRWIDDLIGYGLFAEEEIHSGSYVGEYTGIVRRNDLRRYFGPLNNYCYEYPVPDEIGKSFVIDATQGNLTRFINHSFTPNLKPIHVFYDGFYHLIFLAIHRIEKGVQLSYDYGQNYWHLRHLPRQLQ